MSDVVFKELECINSQKIGIVELNNPKALNALTLNMIRLIHQQLIRWESDENIQLLILLGAEDKAFCAGGDVVSLYKAITDSEKKGVSLNDAEILKHKCYDFFKEEYDLDSYIHKYTKPIIAWGDGYVFGGGLGLFAGASHRVTTEKSTLSMPETAIGLYPDVGASWFLNKMPNNLGVFLGITGAFFNTSDAKYLGLSDFSILSIDKVHLLECLMEIHWGSVDENHLKINQALTGFEESSISKMPISNIKLNENIITTLLSSNHIDNIYTDIVNASLNDTWMKTAQHKLKAASNLSILLTYKQLQLSKSYTKAECFHSELNLSLRCCQYKEFREGVRAQLVDKDKSPKWSFQQIDKITPELISWFFTPIAKV